MRIPVRAELVLCLFALPWFALAPPGLLGQPEREMTASQHAGTEAELSRQLSADPKNGSLWFALGVARAQRKEIDPAIEAFEKALSFLPEKASVYFDLGLLYMEKKNLERAEEAYGRGLALDPSNIPANQNDAFLLMQRGAFREALLPLERLKQSKPDDLSLRATLVEACLKAGLKDKGRNEIDELTSSQGFTSAKALALAGLFATQGVTDAAQRVLEFTRSNWPASAEAHGELGLLLAEKGQFKEAARELKPAVQLDPQSEKYSEAYGESLLNSGQYPTAFQFLQDAAKRFPDQLNFQYQLAFADVGLQRFPEAASLLEALAARRPDSGKVQFLLGGAYELQGDLQRGGDHYRSAIQLAPREPNAYRALGALLQKQGAEHLAESIRLLRKALALDPADVESKIVLARCLEDQEQLDEAEALLEQAVASEPSLLRAHTALAQLYHRQKKVDLAQLQQAIAAKLEGEKIAKESDIGAARPAARP
jgi:tetratricopeptide (TPR) repeat protein